MARGSADRAHRGSSSHSRGCQQYDLRHAAVHCWQSGVLTRLNRRVDGPALAVLKEVYAACLYGQGVIAKRGIQEPLGH